MSSYHVDQLGRVVELRAHPDEVQMGMVGGCRGCLYYAFQHCSQSGERPLKADGKLATCMGGIFVEVTHE